MNTRRTRKSTNMSNNNKSNKQLKEKEQIRKCQKSKIDSSDENNSSDNTPAENSLKKVNDLNVKRKQRKRSKFDTDDEVDAVCENEGKSSKNRKRHIQNLNSNNDGSSSDSSVGDYLKTAEQIDLNSTFFTTEKCEKQLDFDAIERKIFTGIQQLSDSSESEDIDKINETINKSEIKMKPSVSDDIETNCTNFLLLDNYNKKLEEAKACVENYENKKTNDCKKISKAENNQDITRLLSVGEAKTRDSIDSCQNDYISDDDLDWEEIEENIDKPEESVKIPKEGVQITVEMPSVVRKKTKQVDFMAVIKRRLNRIKKENQTYVHKVHLLCWLAHGNYVNSVLNNELLLGQALSLLPSEQCYPPKHADIKYLEQITHWYGKMMKLHKEISVDNKTSIKEQINQQISKKQATSKRNFILLFIIILRSLGLQCRLVLSFQCLPLRPPNSELCSLSTKDNKVKDKNKKSDNSDLANATTSEESCSKRKTSKNKPATVKTGIKSKLNKSLNDSMKSKLNQSLNDNIKSKLNQSLNTSKSSDIIKLKESFTSVDIKKSSENKGKLKSRSNKKSSSKKEEKSIKNELKYKETVKTKSASSSKSNSSSNNKSNKNLNSDSKSHLKKEINTELTISQVDGADDSPSSSKLTKNKLRNKTAISSKLKINLEDDSESEFCISKRHPRVAKSKPVKYVDSESAVDSAGTSSSHKTGIKDINHNKKSNSAKERRKTSNEIKASTSYSEKPQKIQMNVRDDIVNLLKGKMSEQRHVEKSKRIRKSSQKHDPDYDSDFAPESSKKTKNSDSTVVKQRVKPKSELMLLEDENSQDEKKNKGGNDVWIEVFLEEEEKWISVDLIKGQVHCVTELYNRASHPVSYIIAWNNNLSLKDITARYCSNWNTVTRKLRVDQNWWYQTLKPFVGIKTARDREEDEDLARQQLDKPLPTTINEYKNHPLYALKRHLLKFEAIYPPDAVTLGFVRSEPVYARECVHTLHSREIWVKHAKVVKPSQEPYKIVKARPKYDKYSGNFITNLPLELFGRWQVEDYVPPTAENGIVPRNAFGNVELFKACMLPKKTVHLKLPGLNKVARKLRIDCASAVVGFDFHAGGSHPTFDGFVVCEEFKEVLIAAWEEDQEITAKKELEKYEKRVYGNWRKLIKGLLIRERLKARYDFKDPSTEKKKLKHSKAKKRKTNDESPQH